MISIHNYILSKNIILDEGAEKLGKGISILYNLTFLNLNFK
jgi:hypothetical protein